MPLSDQEKVQVRRHLAYLNSSELSTYWLGVPAGVETQFLIERAMGLFVKEDALPMIRQVLCELDAVEKQRASVRGSISVAKVGGIELRDPAQALDALAREYVRLIGDLSNAFGVGRNPFDHRGGVFGIPVT